MQLLWFPQASVAVKVTVAAPLAPHRSLRLVKSLVTTALPLQTSLAVTLASQALIWPLLPEPSHSKTALVVQAITGAVVSCTDTVRVQLLWLPQASVAVNVTVAAPLAPHKSLRPV